MPQTYKIYQRIPFSKHYYIGGDHGAVVDMKFKYLSKTDAQARFNGAAWKFGSSFINNKFTAQRINPNDEKIYVFNDPFVSNKGSIEIDGREYVFKRSLLTKIWKEFDWEDNGENVFLRFTVKQLIPTQTGQVKQFNQLPQETSIFLMAFGLYLIFCRY